MDKKMLVLVTAGGRENAETLARTLVEERLAACVNIIPGIRSFYRWEGKIADDEELLLLIKTTSALFDDLRSRVLELHAYELPEVVGFTLDAGHQAYLDWIEKETR